MPYLNLSQSGGEWVLSHSASGMRVCSNADRRNMETLAEKLEKMPISWESSDPFGPLSEGVKSKLLGLVAEYKKKPPYQDPPPKVSAPIIPTEPTEKKKSEASGKLYERYRPRTWGELVGQERIIKRIEILKTKGGGIGSNAFWISGKSGTGKTTIAGLIAREINPEWQPTEIDAADCTPAYLRELEADMQSYSWGGNGGKTFIINEAHKLSGDAIGKLLVMLERLPRHVCMIFTTTGEGEERFEGGKIDGKAFLSRCVRLPLESEGLRETYAEHLQRIAIKEGLDGQPLSAYLDLVDSQEGNLRACLEEIGSGGMI